jgi:hypothetical protein
MASTFSTSMRRGRTAIAAAVVVAGLAVAGSAPARAAASTTAPAPRACVPGKIVDFCRAVPPGHGCHLANGVYTTIDGPGASLTVLYSINNRGRIIGAYVDAAGKSQHFLLHKGAGGPFTPIDYPAPPSPSPSTSTTATRWWAATSTPPASRRGLCWKTASTP